MRVQIKSTSYLDKRGAYRVDVRWRSGTERYTAKHIEFVVAYVHDLDAWYVIPIEFVKGANLALYPHRPDAPGALEKFRNAWNLLET